MDNTERMMIMGMCLQGLLANPSLSGKMGKPMTQEDLAEQIAANIHLAHRYADALDPPHETTDAERIAKLTRVAYEVLKAADADGAGKWLPFDEARVSAYNDDQDNVDGVFERVSRWYADPTGFPETIQDRIIAAIVASGRD